MAAVKPWKWYDDWEQPFIDNKRLLRLIEDDAKVEELFELAE